MSLLKNQQSVSFRLKHNNYPKDIAAQIEEEKHLRKETTEPKIAIPGEVLEMSEADLRKLIDEYLTEDRIFEHVKEIVNQSKPQRIVINLPAWLKERLKHKSAKKGLSMNAVMRLALTEYLAKDE